jgi:hypothetical protein
MITYAESSWSFCKKVYLERKKIFCPIIQFYIHTEKRFNRMHSQHVSTVTLLHNEKLNIIGSVLSIHEKCIQSSVIVAVCRNASVFVYPVDSLVPWRNVLWYFDPHDASNVKAARHFLPVTYRPKMAGLRSTSKAKCHSLYLWWAQHLYLYDPTPQV